MAIKEEILQAVKVKFISGPWDKRSQIDAIINETDFFLQKGQDAYHDFMAYKVDEKVLEQIYIAMDQYSRQSKKARLNMKSIEDIFNDKGMDSVFEDKLYELFSYLSETAPRKQDFNWYYNEYGASRDIANSGVQAPNWILSLVSLKLYNNFLSLPPVLRYSISYIKNPGDNISIVSDTHRETLSVKLLEKPVLDNDSFCDDIKNVFAEHENKVANPINFSILCARMLYDADIKRIWQ